MSDSLQHMDCSPPESSIHGILQARIWSGLLCLPLGDLPDHEIKPTFPAAPALQADSLPLSHGGKCSGRYCEAFYIFSIICGDEKSYSNLRFPNS